MSYETMEQIELNWEPVRRTYTVSELTTNCGA